MDAGRVRESDWVQLGGLIAGATFVLTASFVGALSFGRVPDLWSRVPWYLIAAAAVFVGTIVLLERHDAPGGTIIVTAIVIGLVGFVAVTLGVEGVIFAFQHPEAVFDSRLLLYFMAAALAATGIGYWALNHWREFTAGGP